MIRSVRNTGIQIMSRLSWPDRADQTLYELAAQEDRCAPRETVVIPATLRQSGSKGFHTDVLDLALGGFSASALNRMHPGAICWLTLPSLAALQAEVVWWEAGVVGCAFADLLSPIILDALVSRFRGRGDGVYRPV